MKFVFLVATTTFMFATTFSRQSPRVGGVDSAAAGTPAGGTRTASVSRPRPAASQLKNGGEHGPLRIESRRGRPVMVRADDSIFPWIGASDFALFARFARGEDITPILDERIELGFTILRVFTMFDRFGIGAAAGIGELNPAATPDLYAKLREFIDLVAARGLRLEVVALADADSRLDGTGGLTPTTAAQQAHLTRVLEIAAATWNVTVEWSNEAFKNAQRVTELTGDCRAHHVLCAYGTSLPGGPIPAAWPSLDYITIHDHERGSEWPRTSLRYGEVVNRLRKAVVADEPMGFAESQRADARAADPDDAAYFAATAAMFASGSTFHSDDGVASRLFSPTQKEAAKAWAWAARWVPPEAQLAPAQQGGNCGTAGAGNMPIQHCNLDAAAASRALSTFCKLVSGVEYCVRIRPVGPAVARDGWTITSEPRPGFVMLGRAR